MPEGLLTGTICVLLGGVLEGSFALPMSHARNWRWENIWAIYSLFGLLIIPWWAAAASVPSLQALYRSIPGSTLAMIALFGFGWGVANVLFGLAVPRVGMAISFAIVVGMSAALGSVVPLLILTPGRLYSSAAYYILTGLLLALLGIVLLGIAGRKRERRETRDSSQANTKRDSGFSGLIFCVLGGVLAPMLNFSFAFGADVPRHAVALGATPALATNAIWSVALTGGFLSNAGFAAFQLTRNRSWTAFVNAESGTHWLASGLMGVLWAAGLLLYGQGAAALGTLGPVIGWPIFQISIILISSLWGSLRGEWRDAGQQLIWMNQLALLFLVLSIGALSVGNRP
jgi:L-rhamnose-H+ transport protein